MSHPIVHIEIPANKTGEAASFYSEVFGWKAEVDEMYGYAQFAAEGGPGGGFVGIGGDGPMVYKPDRLMVYIGTDDIDASLASVEAHGGKTVLPNTEIPHVGWFAIFTDPTGNHVALFKAAM